MTEQILMKFHIDIGLRSFTTLEAVGQEYDKTTMKRE
jgi:hypothetical protein